MRTRFLWNVPIFFACVAASLLTSTWWSYTGVCLLLAVVNTLGFAEGRYQRRTAD